MSSVMVGTRITACFDTKSFICAYPVLLGDRIAWELLDKLVVKFEGVDR
jgi:hypothetical protein